MRVVRERRWGRGESGGVRGLGGGERQERISKHTRKQMEIRITPNTLRGHMSSHAPKCDHHTHMCTLIVIFIRLYKSNHPHPLKRSIISVHTGLLYQHQQQKHHNTTQLHFSFTIIITPHSMYICAHILLHVCYLHTRTTVCCTVFKLKNNNAVAMVPHTRQAILFNQLSQSDRACTIAEYQQM